MTGISFIGSNGYYLKAPDGSHHSRVSISSPEEEVCSTNGTQRVWLSKSADIISTPTNITFEVEGTTIAFHGDIGDGAPPATATINGEPASMEDALAAAGIRYIQNDCYPDDDKTLLLTDIDLAIVYSLEDREVISDRAMASILLGMKESPDSPVTYDPREARGGESAEEPFDVCSGLPANVAKDAGFTCGK